MNRKKFRLRWGSRSPFIALGIISAIILVGLYCFRLDGLASQAPGEVATIQSLSGLSSIIDNPLLLPYKLMASLFLGLPGNDTVAVRLASVTISLITIGLFYVLAQRWYGRLNGMAITVLFATTGWMLHTGRYGAGYIALTLLVLGILNLTVWANNTDKSKLVLPLYATGIGLGLFIPGGLWFILVSLYICRKALIKHLRTASGKYFALGALILAIAVGLLVQAFARDMSLVQQWIGLPANMPGPTDLAKQAALSVSGLVLRGPVLPQVWLAHTPLLDVAASTLLVLGVVFYRRHLRNPRTHLLILFAAISVVLITFNGAAALSYIVPLAYLVVGGGFSYLLHQWRKVFPQNPIAEGVALSILGILILCAASFHLQRYFIAWHNSPSAIEARLPATSGSDPLPYLIQ